MAADDAAFLIHCHLAMAVRLCVLLALGALVAVAAAKKGVSALRAAVAVFSLCGFLRTDIQ